MARNKTLTRSCHHEKVIFVLAALPGFTSSMQ